MKNKHIQFFTVLLINLKLFHEVRHSVSCEGVLPYKIFTLSEYQGLFFL